MPGVTFGSHSTIHYSADAKTSSTSLTLKSTQCTAQACATTDAARTGLDEKQDGSKDARICADGNFFVRLIPDDGAASRLSDDEEEATYACMEFSGIHAKALFASRVLTDMLHHVQVDPRQEVDIPMYGETKSSLNRLLRWLFRSQLASIFEFDRNIWKYARLADKYDIPLLRQEIEQFYLKTWPPGCNDLRSQFVIFNESCRYHLACRDAYLGIVVAHLVDFFKTGFFAKLMDIDLVMARKLAA